MSPVEFIVQWISSLRVEQRRNSYAKALRSERRQRDSARQNPEAECGAFCACFHRQLAQEILQCAKEKAPIKLKVQ